MATRTTAVILDCLLKSVMTVARYSWPRLSETGHPSPDGFLARVPSSSPSVVITAGRRCGRADDGVVGSPLGGLRDPHDGLFIEIQFVRGLCVLLDELHHFLRVVFADHEPAVLDPGVSALNAPCLFLCSHS